MGASYVLQLLFCKKNHKIPKNSKTTAREKLNADLESLEVQKNFDVCLTKFENNKILLDKIRHRILLTTKLFIDWVKDSNYTHN